LDFLEQNEMKSTSLTGLTWSDTGWCLSPRLHQAALSRIRIPWPGCTSWGGPRHPEGHWKVTLDRGFLAWMERPQQCITMNEDYVG
jgi:hypothetical protein